MVSDDKKRVTISLPIETLKQLDELATKYAVSRSGAVNLLTRKAFENGNLL